MIFELTLGNVITVAALFIAALYALVKVITIQQDRHLSDRFKTLDATLLGSTCAVMTLSATSESSKRALTTLRCAWSALWIRSIRGKPSEL